MKLKRTLCVVFGTLIALFVSPVAGVAVEMEPAKAWEAVGFYYLLPFLLLWLGLGLAVYGCYLWAKLKGRHWAWMFFGLLTPIGLIFLYKLRVKCH